MKRNIVIGITGASGSIYASLLFKRLLQIKEQINEAGVIFSEKARDIWKYEMEEEFEQTDPFHIYEADDFYAPFASGSSCFDTLIVCPCSMGTLGRIASGTSNDLITRAADVMLKEARKLILVPRETPYNLIHVNNMKRVILSGGIICPASPSFYSKPGTIEQLAETVTERILILAGFNINSYSWGKT